MKQTTEIKTREFVNPETLLKAVPIEPGMVIADFGCGNGHYTTAAAELAGKKGHVTAFDVMEEALSQTATLAKLLGLHNVATRQCDLEKLGSCAMPETSCDLVIISGIMHQSDKRENVLREAYRVLKTGGRILVVEWEADSPLGPAAADRISKSDMQGLLEKFSFRPLSEP